MKLQAFFFLLLNLFFITAFCVPTTNSSASNHLIVRQETSAFHNWHNLFGHGPYCYDWCGKNKGNSKSKGNNNINGKKPSPKTENSASSKSSKRDIPLFNINHVAYSTKLIWHKGLLRRFWDFLETQTGSTMKSFNEKHDSAKRYAAAEPHNGEEHSTTTISVLPASITNPHSLVTSLPSLLWDNSSTAAIVTATTTNGNVTTSGGFIPTLTSTPPPPSSISSGEKRLWDSLTILGGLIFWAAGRLLI